MEDKKKILQAQIIEPGTYTEWRKTPAPDKSHTEPMNQTNQPGEPEHHQCVCAPAPPHGCTRDRHQGEELRDSNRFYLFTCWITFFFFMNLEWIVPRVSTREAFTVAHRHTLTHTQVFEHIGNQIRNRTAKTAEVTHCYWWPAAGAGDSLCQTASDPV